MDNETALLLELFERDFTLAETYPYTAWVGAQLRAQQPAWWEQFTVEAPAAATLPLAQARDYAFCAWLEAVLPRDELVPLLSAAVTELDWPLLAELENTVSWYCRR